MRWLLWTIFGGMVLLSVVWVGLMNPPEDEKHIDVTIGKLSGAD